MQNDYYNTQIFEFFEKRALANREALEADKE